MQCPECKGDVLSTDVTVKCKVCKKPAHVDCAKLSMSLTRSAKAFKCKSCINQNVETSSQVSDGSECTEDDSIKALLTKLNQKHDTLLQKVDNIEKLSIY